MSELGLLSMILLLAPHVAAQEPEVPAAQALWRAMQDVNERAAPGELQSTAEELSRQPKMAVALLRAWASREVTPSREKLLELVSQEIDGRDAIDAATTHIKRASNPAWRRAVLHILEPHATSTEVVLIANWMREAPEDEHELFEEFSATLVSVIRRDGGALEELDDAMSFSPHLEIPAIRAVGRSGEPDGLEWLAAQLHRPELTAPVLQEIGRLATTCLSPSSSEASERVRAFLHSKDGYLRRQAFRVVIVLRDTTCVSDLITLSERSQGAEQAMVFSALRDLVGYPLPDRSAAWRAWFEEQEDWMSTEAPYVLERLVSEDDAEVVAAVRSLSQHPLYRDVIAVELARLLRDHPSATVRSQVCQALARLLSHVVLPDLMRSLEDSDPLVQACAQAALNDIVSACSPGQGWNIELGTQLLR